MAILAESAGLRIVCAVLGFYNLILFARVLLSWFPRVPEGLRPIVDVIYGLTEPIVRFARPLIPPLRIGNVALDLSILLVFILLGVIRSALQCGPFLGF